jgi:hypothetical protein
MEDEVIQTTQPTPEVVANTSPESTTDYVQEPVAQQPETLSPETIMHNERLNSYASKGESIRNWINNDYNYNKNDAGTLWVAGAINDVNTQMSFLEATLNEDLYDEMDLQKYFFDQNLATARAYAKEKKSETAYGFYKAAQEKATAEGELTGWYMPPEAGYMLGQWTIAKENLKDPSLSAEDRARAESVVRATQGWFDANNITERGIECLNNLYLKETIRHNQETEELQRQANNIAAQKANASASDYDLSLREFKYQQAEMELKYGADINKDTIIGHTDEFAYRGQYTTQVEWIEAGHMGAAIDMWGTDHVKGILGDRYTEFNRKYESDNTYKTARKEVASKKAITEDSKIFKPTGKKTDDGHEIKYAVMNNKVVVGYFEDGVWVTITDENAKFSDGKSIKAYVEKSYGKDSMNTKKVNAITIDGETYSIGRGSTSNNSDSYTSLVKAGYKKKAINNNSHALSDEGVKEVDKLITASQTDEGVKTKDGKTVRNLKYKQGYIDKKNVNEFVILEGEDGEYYAPEQKVDGSWQLKKLKKHDIEKIEKASKNYKVGDYWDDDGGMFGDNNKHEIAKASWYMGTDSKTGTHYMYVPTGDGYEIVGIRYTNKGSKSAEDSYSESYKAGTGHYKVVSINPSEKELNKAGINLPKDTNEPVSTKNAETLTLNSYKSDDEITEEKTKTSKETKSSSSSEEAKAPANNNSKQSQSSKKEVRRLSKTSEEQVLEDAQTVTPFNKKDEEEENNKFTGQFLATV